MARNRRKKKIVWIFALVIATALSVWISQRWRVWFYNPEELAYIPASEPHRVLLTFGDEYGETSRNVSWQCDTVVKPSWVELACDNDTVRVEAQGEVFVSRSGRAAYYVARLRQLKHDARYSYRVQTNGKPSKWYSFSTSVATPGKVSFLYVGDVQDTLNGEANRFLKEALQRHPASEFLVCGGDLTERPTNQHWEETFRDIDSVAQHLPLVCVTGNHDYLKGIIMKLERRFPLTYSYFLDSKVDENQVYTFHYGPAQFFLLDSNRELPFLLTQRHWLEEQLEKSTSRWKIVIVHHPLFSLRGNNNLIQRWAFNDLIEKYGIDLVLQGHEHAYGRMTHHDGSGRATSPVYTVSHCSPKNYKIKPGKHFDKIGKDGRYYQTVSIDADTMIMATYEVYHHTLFDSLRIIKRHKPLRAE